MSEIFRRLETIEHQNHEILTNQRKIMADINELKSAVSDLGAAVTSKVAADAAELAAAKAAGIAPADLDPVVSDIKAITASITPAA